jgi:hypothetical protein
MGPSLPRGSQQSYRSITQGAERFRHVKDPRAARYAYGATRGVAWGYMSGLT